MKNNFDKWLNEFTRGTVNDAGPLIFISILAWFFGMYSIVGMFIHVFTDLYVAPILILSGVIFLIMNLFFIGEMLIGWICKFVTRDEYHYDNAASRYLFGDTVAGNKYEYEHTIDSRYNFETAGRLSFFNLLASALTLTLSMFLFIPMIMISLLIIVGIGVAILMTARKAFDLSRNLRNHINDKNIHNKEKD